MGMQGVLLSGFESVYTNEHPRRFEQRALSHPIRAPFRVFGRTEHFWVIHGSAILFRSGTLPRRVLEPATFAPQAQGRPSGTSFDPLVALLTV
jgi:hypothetical protein